MGDERVDETVAEIVLLLDRSGSMEPLRRAAIDGVNALLAEQRRQAGRARLTLVLFDDEYLRIHEGVPLSEVPDLDAGTYVPRGSTALLDAWARAMAETEARIAQLDPADRPDQVLFAVLTDGLENASREVDPAQLFRTVSRHREEDGWTFLYLGANQDAEAVGAGYGVPRATSMTFSACEQGTRTAMGTLSGTISGARQGLGWESWLSDEVRRSQSCLLGGAKKKKLLH